MDLLVSRSAGGAICLGGSLEIDRDTRALAGARKNNPRTAPLSSPSHRPANGPSHRPANGPAHRPADGLAYLAHYLAQGWRLCRAFHTLTTRIAPKEARLLRLARSTGDLTRKARTVRQWANGCEQSIVKHARLQQAARRFERTRERLQMATALGAMNAAQVMVPDGP